MQKFLNIFRPFHFGIIFQWRIYIYIYIYASKFMKDRKVELSFFPSSIDNYSCGFVLFTLLCHSSISNLSCVSNSLVSKNYPLNSFYVIRMSSVDRTVGSSRERYVSSFLLDFDDLERFRYERWVDL